MAASKSSNMQTWSFFGIFSRSHVIYLIITEKQHYLNIIWTIYMDLYIYNSYYMDENNYQL